MALTPAELAYSHVALGTDADEDDLLERYTRTGDLDLAIIEVLRQRRSDLLTEPTSYAISGVYSQSNAGLLAALDAQIAAVSAAAGVGATFEVGRLVRADRR